MYFENIFYNQLHFKTSCFRHSSGHTSSNNFGSWKELSQHHHQRHQQTSPSQAQISSPHNNPQLSLYHKPPDPRLLHPDKLHQYHQMLRAQHGIPPPPQHYPYYQHHQQHESLKKTHSAKDFFNSFAHQKNSVDERPVALNTHRGGGVRVKSPQELGQQVSHGVDHDPGCAVCGGEANFVCSQCKQSHYCSEQCQVRASSSSLL